MTCIEAANYVSAICDGEQVPPEAVTHIDACALCRDSLRAYSEIGIEIRLMAGRNQASSLMPAELRGRLRASRNGWARFLQGKVLLPRFAVAALTLALLSAVPLSLTLLHAQSKPLWFQFELQPRPLGSGLPNFQIAKDGYDEPLGWMFPKKKQGLPDMVGARLVVKSIQEGRVDLEIAAHNYGTGTTFPTAMFRDKLNLRPVLYSPDQTLTIPIEGGGTLYLRGQVLDHQPQLAWGWPLEPRRDQLMIRSPLLVEDDHVLANLQGANALAEGNSQIAFINSPGNGNFIFGFEKVPGAVEAQANWGQITFKLDGKSYLLKTSAPICGGDQPRTVWVKLRPQLNDKVSLGTGPATLFAAGPDS